MNHQHTIVRKVLAAVAICFAAAATTTTLTVATPVAHAVVTAGTSHPDGQPDPNG